MGTGLWVWILIGSTLGGLVPLLWGGSMLSVSAICSAVSGPLLDCGSRGNCRTSRPHIPSLPSMMGPSCARGNDGRSILRVAWPPLRSFRRRRDLFPAPRPRRALCRRYRGPQPLSRPKCILRRNLNPAQAELPSLEPHLRFGDVVPGSHTWAFRHGVRRLDVSCWTCCSL